MKTPPTNAFKPLFTYLFTTMLLSCSNKMKEVVAPAGITNKVVSATTQNSFEVSPASRTKIPVTQATKYTIFAGQHYCTPNLLKFVTLSEMRFSAVFDVSAVYNLDNFNQYDINKLYGFSEGFDHHRNSARIGWRWSDGQLRLFAYAYNNGIVASREITTVAIGAENICSIKLAGNTYVFTVNGISVVLERAASSSTASGYQLYPYFGGDEVAPHNISISIKNL
ncbi:hypothetical protein EXU57_22785 [Segetibacter sp. 3557_3]|uniref:hypothetical protein n=1 Tax=Segetibacter sp. 3557_3 TaxID=2547429 RepID=UPI0010586531|nr:hypothetical protein [Segetibacter sp. 3557_3]TDH19730.1 hypothetical protein EXU57_22785 [Segetibacter sp. 3557_3]